MAERPSPDVILEEAVGISDPEQRVDFLDRACAGDAELRAEIESLLAAYDGGGAFLDAPATPGLEWPRGKPDDQIGHDRPEGAGSFRTPGGSFGEPEPARLTELLDGYEVAELIACGGMGAVYRARQVELEREVAIKVLPWELSRFKEFKEGFRTEARAMAKMNHPNLVGVYDFGEVEGMLYLVMEYVHGSSLLQAGNGEAVKAQYAVRIIAGIAAGLGHAHKHGILHRDIKPANILITHDLEPKLGDFGLAVPTADVGSGLKMGTPGYMPPEVVRDFRSATPASDVYSLGIILHELLTGVRPTGETPANLEGVPRLRGLCALVQKATARAPYMRYADGEEMAKALRKWLAEAEKVPLRVLTAANSGGAVRSAARPPMPVGPGRAGKALSTWDFDLLNSSKGTAIIGTVIGLFVLTGFAVLLKVVIDGIRDPGKPMIKVEIRDLKRDIGRATRNIEDLNEELVVQKGQIETNSRLEARKAELVQGQSRLADLQDESEPFNRKHDAVSEDWKRYLDDYVAAERRSAVGETHNPLKLATGEVLPDVEIRRCDPDWIQVRYDGGQRMRGIAYHDLPRDMRNRLDPPVPAGLQEWLASNEPPVPPAVPSGLCDLEQRIRFLRAEIENQTKELANTRNQAKVARQRIKGLEARKTQLKKDIEAKMRDIELDRDKPVSREPILREELKDLKHKERACSKLVDAPGAKASVLDQEAAKLEAEIERLKNELAAKMEEFRQLQDEDADSGTPEGELSSGGRDPQRPSGK